MWIRSTNGSTRSIDPNRDNDGLRDGVESTAFQTAWNTGMLDLSTRLRHAVSSDYSLLPNGNLTNFDMNGCLFETFLNTSTKLDGDPYDVPGWNQLVWDHWRDDQPEGSDYFAWAASGTAPNYTTVMNYPVNHSSANFTNMRYALCTALLADGYFAWGAGGYAGIPGFHNIPPVVRRVRQRRSGQGLSRPADGRRLLGRLQRVAPRLRRGHRAREPRHRRPHRQPGRHLPQDQGHPGADGERRQPRHAGHPAAADGIVLLSTTAGPTPPRRQSRSPHLPTARSPPAS